MVLSAFEQAAGIPGDDALREVLGRSGTRWFELKEHLAERCAPLTEEWISSKNAGWSLRLKRKKRAIVYMTPCKRHFLAGFALGEKAVRAAHEAGLPDWVLEIIDAAPRYAEGRGVGIEVRTKKDLRGVEQVVAIKMAN